MRPADDRGMQPTFTFSPKRSSPSTMQNEGTLDAVEAALDAGGADALERP